MAIYLALTRTMLPGAALFPLFFCASLVVGVGYHPTDTSIKMLMVL